MIRSVVSVFKIPELRRKILFTILILAVFRFGSYVPIPGTHADYLGRIAGARDVAGGGGDEGGFGGYLNFIARITGGSFEPFLFALGIMPYISASIILQLLTQAIPSLEKLAKEGEAGRRKINEYTRYLTVLLCVIQASMVTSYRNAPGPDGWRGIESSTIYLFVCITAMTGGTIFLMWLGELIEEFGIGNGISLIIMAGIVDRLPAVGLYLGRNAQLAFRSWDPNAIGIEKIVLIVGMFVGVIIAVVAITQAQRRVPIQQAKHTRGRRIYGGQRQYLPLRVNQAGVIPVIFASSLLMLPMHVFGYLSGAWRNSFTRILEDAFSYGNIPHLLAYIALIYIFCYFWTAIQFQPKEMADNLRNYGSFIPGRRPGASTARYLERVMNRITYVGAGFLAAVAILPIVISRVTGVNMIVTGFLGGTGLLIIVSVALDLVQRIESHLIMRHYEGFLAQGRVRGRRG